MYMLLVASSESVATRETVKDLVDAALARGHRVTVFFSDESVRLVKADGDPELIGLLKRGVRLLICRTHAMLSGLASAGAFADGVENSSLGELVDLMEESDRTLFVGGETVW